METIYYKARQRKIKDHPSLKDRRALYYDEIGISINALNKMETDNAFIPHPNDSAKLITYFQDMILAQDVCRICPITKTKSDISLKKKSSLNNNYGRNDKTAYSLYNKAYQRKIKRIKKELYNKDKDKTFYYYARLKAALSNPELSNRYNLQILTGYSSQVLSKIENDESFIPQVEVSNDLLKLYMCRDFAKEICKNCPVSQACNKL